MTTLDGLPDSPHETIDPRFCCCLFCASWDVSDFLWGNILYTGKVVEILVSVEDAPSAPLRGGRKLSSHAFGFRVMEPSKYKY